MPTGKVLGINEARLKLSKIDTPAPVLPFKVLGVFVNDAGKRTLVPLLVLTNNIAKMFCAFGVVKLKDNVPIGKLGAVMTIPPVTGLFPPTCTKRGVRPVPGIGTYCEVTVPGGSGHVYAC